MCDDCCKQLSYAIKGESMEPSEHSCQRNIDTDDSSSKSESKFEFCMAKELNNMKLASEKSKSNVELEENEQRTEHEEKQAGEQIYSAQTSDKQAENSQHKDSKEREEGRPLVLEERHSLSIAETKKRRARVHSNEHLFIPKELARSELHQRTYYSSVNTLDQISRNSDYCIRMLKFPVGSGRARYVAQQMQKKEMRKTQKQVKSQAEVDCIKSEPNDQTTEENKEVGEQFDDVLTANMPNLEEQNEERGQLQSDDERCIVLEDIFNANSQETETEEDGTDELIERVYKRQLKEDVQLNLKQREEMQLNPCFRWHDPNCSDKDIKMGLMDDFDKIKNQIDFSGDEEAQQQQPQQELLQGEAEESKVIFFEQTEEYPLDNMLPAIPPQEDEQQQQQQQPYEETANTLNMPISEQYQYFSNMPPTTAAATATSNILTFETQRNADLTLSSLMMQRFSLPPMPTAAMLQPNSENLQHSFVEPLNMLQHFERRLYLPPSTHVLQQQHQTFYNEHQLEAGQNELQQLNAEYHALKMKEAHQLNGLNKTLKRLFVNRQLRERQHADYQRMFLQKMEKSKKQEESVYEQQNQLKRQLQTELSSLEQRIADKQRQLLERKRTWHWQRQQYLQQQEQQQQQLQQEQHQHFFRQLQAPAHPPRLQCFQDAFLHCQILPGGQHRPLPPMIPPPAPPPRPPISAYCASNQQHPVAQSFNGCIMRRQRIIDYRAHTMSPYIHPFEQPSASALPHSGRISFAHATDTNDSMFRHFALPDFSESSGRRDGNQTVEQTAITSILSNYATNYFNDMETNRSMEK